MILCTARPVKQMYLQQEGKFFYETFPLFWLYFGIGSEKDLSSFLERGLDYEPRTISLAGSDPVQKSLAF